MFFSASVFFFASSWCQIVPSLLLCTSVSALSLYTPLPAMALSRERERERENICPHKICKVQRKWVSEMCTVLKTTGVFKQRRDKQREGKGRDSESQSKWTEREGESKYRGFLRWLKAGLHASQCESSQDGVLAQMKTVPWYVFAATHVHVWKGACTCACACASLSTAESSWVCRSNMQVIIDKRESKWASCKSAQSEWLNETR